ncbi:MAG: hypothetical protein FWG70_03595 [Oscillospiraceae bacterium]|nr:hypothetical protein [Oscillospiraceae bacterium]
MKKIYIVLIQSPTVPAKLIGLFKRSKYTHAALSLDEKLRSMFSFGRHWISYPCPCGFKQENFNEGIYGKFADLPGVVLELVTTDEQYEKMLVKLDDFLLKSKHYKYNYLGLLANFFRLDYKHKNRFFCSEFVYYILYESGIFDLHTPRVFVSPEELLKVSEKVVYRGNLKSYIEQTT